jgi:hypothetical protein
VVLGHLEHAFAIRLRHPVIGLDVPAGSDVGFERGEFRGVFVDTVVDVHADV